METCGEADSAKAAIESIGKAEPDLAILDISLKDTSGIELLKQLKAQFPDLKILMLSMHDESVVVQRALLAGASGYIMKEEASEKTLAAIRCVLAGNIYLSREIASRLDHRLSREAGSIHEFEPLREDAHFFGAESNCQILYSPVKRCIALPEEGVQEIEQGHEHSHAY
ncbi:MAG: two component transcriptional regulator, LuxR family [Verrucomicrobiales bacterium]|nr:two component transcriptional regulator, LuxR family [Verrucomicrobiales bacterium]